MATIQNINVSTPNDGLGDTLRASQIKSNENFAELNSKKVEKIAGKDLSSNDFTSILQNKLNSIASGAEVNVKSDWNQEDDQADDFIKNKPVGQFLQAFGTLHYSSSLTAQSATANVELKLLNNTLGVNTNITNAPFGVSNLWNATTNRFDFSSLEVGDYVELRPDLDIDLVGSNTSFSVYMKMAIGSLNTWQLNIHNGERKSTDSFNEAPYIGFDISNEDTKTFPAEIFIKTDANATVKVNGWLVAITRKSVNIIDIEAGDEYVINKQNNLTLDGTGTKYPTVDAVNNNLVHKQGNETIEGVKTFIASPIVPTATTSGQAVNFGQMSDISIPLSGTELNKPITGSLEFEIIKKIYAKSTGTNAIDAYFAFREVGSNPFTVPLIGYTDNENFDYNWEFSNIGILGSTEFTNDGTDRKIYPQTGWVQDAIADSVAGAELTANKNQNNGYCGLDSGGKVPIENLPTTLLKYQGVWNASTNTPTLTNPDTTKVGNVYNVSVAGTRFGITWGLGDWLIYNASGIPEKSDNSDDVVSVNGQTGVVTLTTNHVAENTNLYFTTARVRDTLLDGLSFVVGTAISATDSVLTAFGKLQKQITDLISTALNKSGDTITGNIANTSTGFFRVSSGTTAQRPIAPLDGMIRYNTDTLRNEFYSNGAWRNMARLEGDNFTGAITATNLLGTNTGDQTENNVYLQHDFLTVNGTDFVTPTLISSGTVGISTANSNINNVGILRVTSSTTANSGASIRSQGTSLILKGNEVFNEIINPLTFTNTTHRAGLHDSTTSAEPTNGVYFEYIGNGNISLRTANNGSRNTATTITTLAINTWYKLRITVNSNATSILGEVFNSSGVLIASQTVTTNIPTTARLLNVCSITTNSGTTATALLDIDFISLKTTLIR